MLDLTTEFLHPSSRPEIFPILGGLFYAVAPSGEIKEYYQFRNRGYIFRKYRMLHYLAFDVIRYGYYFLVIRRGDLGGLVRWARLTMNGFFGRFEPANPPRSEPAPRRLAAPLSRAA